MQFFYFLFLLVQAVVGINLVFPLILLALYHLRGKRPAGASLSRTVPVSGADYAIIVTAYQQTHQLPAVIDSLLALNHESYHIYVVADDCDLSTWSLDHPKVLMLRPETVLSGNVKSHFYAIERFVRSHSHLVIIDSDNLVEPDLLSQLSTFFDQGFEAVQGIRKAKNLDTDLARLDAARDIYYHYYDGKVLFGAGSSATLAGSGMAFGVTLYRQCLGQSVVEGAGFDKVLQAEIVSRGKRIAFAPNAVVYDEKTTHSGQLVNQRARWINTWFRFFGYGFGLLGRGIRRPNRNQLLFGFVLLRPPLFLFLAAALFFGFVDLLFFPMLALLWLAGLVLFVAGFMLALRHSNADPRIYASLSAIPRFVFYQLAALLKVRKANRVSVATRHGEPDSPSSQP